MKYNGKEVEVTCTLKNGTPKITIINNNLKFPYTNINKAAKFLVSKYGGTKEEALIALNNLLQDIDKNTVQTETKESNYHAKNTSFNNKKGQALINNLEYGHKDRCIEISIADFFSMSMEEFDTYCRNEFLKKGIDINDLSLPPEKVKEQYKDEIEALEEADAKLQEEENKIKNNIDRLVNHFKQEFKNKYNKDYNPTDREIEQLRIVVVDRYNYSIEQWEGIISTFINSYNENWKSDKSPEPRISGSNYGLVRERVIERAYGLFVQGGTKPLEETTLDETPLEETTLDETPLEENTDETPLEENTEETTLEENTEETTLEENTEETTLEENTEETPLEETPLDEYKNNRDPFKHLNLVRRAN